MTWRYFTPNPLELLVFSLSIFRSSGFCCCCFVVFNLGDRLFLCDRSCIYFSQRGMYHCLWFRQRRSFGFCFLFLKTFSNSHECFLFSFLDFALKLKSPSPAKVLKEFPMCSFLSFVVLLFTFLPWVHLEFSLVYGRLYGPNLIYFPDGSSYPNASKWRVHLYPTDGRRRLI